MPANILGGFNNSLKPVGPNVKVTDILIRGGGGTVTFSDGVTVEYLFGFRQDQSVPSGGVLDVTLVGDRAQLVYGNLLSQAVCDMIDWLLQCSTTPGGSGSVTLDTAYDGGSTIDVDDGAVVLNKTINDVTNALEINVSSGIGAAIYRSGYDEWDGITAPAVAPVGSGRIYLDSGSGRFRVSENGAPYVDLTAKSLEQVLAVNNITGPYDIIINASQKITFSGSASDPPVSAANSGSLTFNSTSQTFRASENGLSYGDVVIERTATLTTTTSGTSAIISITLSDNTAYYVYAYFVGRRTNAADRAVYVREAAVYREGGGGATLQGAIATSLTRESAGYNATLVVAGNTIEARVAGLVGHTINWKLWIRLIPIS